MKINYRNTALEFLVNPKNVPIHTPDAYQKPLSKAEDYNLLYSMRSQFSNKEFSGFFSKKVQYITMPFYDAFRRAEPKLKEVVLKTKIDESGTFIFQWPNHTQTIFYRIKAAGGGSAEGLEAMAVMFTKAAKNDSFALDLSAYIDKDNNQVMGIVWKGFYDEGRDMSWWIAHIMLLITFMKYAEVESKVVKSKRKEHHVGVKYVNETDIKVEVLDSTYFTTISRTEGFGVNGHFRFQPYGAGMKDRRLQWIPAFQKTGYTRRAKILSQ